MLCQDPDLVGTSSELDNEEEEEEEDDDEDYFDDDDSIDDDFEGLSINEEAEIMRYALASSHNHVQQYENQMRSDECYVQDVENGCVDHNTTNNYDFDTCHSRNNNSSTTSSSHNPCSDSNPTLSIYNSTEKLIMETSLFDTKMRLIGNGIVLLVATFALLVLVPLYFQQVTTSGTHFNIFGATFLLSFTAALFFVVLTIALGYAIKWKVPFYKPPLPWPK